MLLRVPKAAHGELRKERQSAVSPEHSIWVQKARVQCQVLPFNNDLG